MDITSVLEDIACSDEELPYSAMESVVAEPGEAVPRLLQRVDELIEALRAGGRPSDAELICLLLLLAELRETRAYATILKVFELPGDVLDSYFGDFLCAGLDGILASVSGGDSGPLRRLAETAELHEGARSCALNAILCLVAAEKLPRGEAVEWVRSVFQRGLRGEGPEPGHELWDALFLMALDLYPVELREDLELARQKGLFDPDHVTWSDLEQVLAGDREEAFDDLRDQYALVDDAIGELGTYLGLDEEELCDEEHHHAHDCGHDHGHFHEHNLDDEAEPQPIVRDAPKVGRNDPCPCGSGKKHKKCCGKGS